MPYLLRVTDHAEVFPRETWFQRLRPKQTGLHWLKRLVDTFGRKSSSDETLWWLGNNPYPHVPDRIWRRHGALMQSLIDEKED